MVTKVNEEMMVFPGSQEFPARKESAGTMVCQDCPEWMAALVEKDLPEHLDRQEFPRAAHQENLGSRVGQERRVILDSLETTVFRNFNATALRKLTISCRTTGTTRKSWISGSARGSWVTWSSRHSWS